MFERKMITNLEKADFTVSSIYQIFLNQNAPVAPVNLYDLPEEVPVPAPHCGCEEGILCDCNYELCDTAKPATTHLASTLTASQRVFDHLQAIKNAYLHSTQLSGTARRLVIDEEAGGTGTTGTPPPTTGTTGTPPPTTGTTVVVIPELKPIRLNIRKAINLLAFMNMRIIRTYYLTRRELRQLQRGHYRRVLQWWLPNNGESAGTTTTTTTTTADGESYC